MKSIIIVPSICSYKMLIYDILVSINSIVKKKQILIKAKSDFLYIKLLSPISGKIKNIFCKINQSITLLDKIFIIQSKNKVFKEYTVLLPDIGAEEVEVTEILIKKNQKVQKDQTLIVVEGSKTSIEIPSSKCGKVKDILVKLGDIIKINTPLITIKNSDINKNSIESFILTKVVNNNHSDIKNINQINKINNHKKTFYVSPIIKKIAKEFYINLNNINGTGRKNRILREDIKNYIKYIMKHKNSLNTLNKKKIISSKDNFILNNNYFSKFGKIKLKKLTNIQKISGKRLYNNWITIPHVTQFEEIDITDVESFRISQNIKFQEQNLNLKLTILSFIIKSVAIALKKFIKFNSSLSDDKDYLIIKNYINIGIAMEIKKGLVVPVINKVHKMNITEIAYQLQKKIQKARSYQLKVKDLEGGCFTISNLGGISGIFFTPIINAPEVGILGISRSITKPVWCKNKFKSRLILPVSLSYDHRVIDGSYGARFIKFIRYLMSDIRRLLI